MIEAILKNESLPDIDAFGQPVQIRIAYLIYTSSLLSCLKKATNNSDLINEAKKLYQKRIHQMV
jgi:hypothetical protein